MNGDEVQLLERELEEAIGKVVQRLAKVKQIGTRPSKQVFHLMAKAAVAVLEAVADEDD
jgi:hypothetical protein